MYYCKNATLLTFWELNCRRYSHTESPWLKVSVCHFQYSITRRWQIAGLQVSGERYTEAMKKIAHEGGQWPHQGLVGVISLISFIALTWYVVHRNGTNTRLLGQAEKACVVTVKILCCRAEHVLLQKLSNHQCKASTVLASETAFKHSPFRCVCKLKFSWRCRKQFHCACWVDILVVSGCAHAHAVWSACHHRLLQVAPFVQYNADWPGLYQI